MSVGWLVGGWVDSFAGILESNEEGRPSKVGFLGEGNPKGWLVSSEFGNRIESITSQRSPGS